MVLTNCLLLLTSTSHFLSGASIRRQALDFPHRPDFNSSDPRSRNAGSVVDRLVEIPGINQEIAANLLAGLREWTVGNEPFPVALRPDRKGAQYYYNVILDVETLSVSDLDELQRWLNGELQPAVRGKRAPLSALRRGFGTLLSRVLGGEKRHYEARSGPFRT